MQNIFFLGSLFALLLFPALSQAQRESDHHQLLPESTMVAFSVADYSAWQRKVSKSSMAGYFAHPGVKAMIKDLASVSNGRFGVMSLLQQNFIRRYAKQQVTIAIVQAQDPTFVLMIDCKNPGEATECSQEINKTVRESRTPLVSATSKSTVFVANNSNLVQQFINNGQANSLASKPAFRKTVLRSNAEVQDRLFWWYVDPLMLASRKVGKPMFARINMYFYDFAKRERFDTVKALGATGAVDSTGKKMTMVGYIDAERPYQRGMRLLDLANAEPASKPMWMRGSLSHGFANLRLDRGLESFSTVFDTVVGEGEEGIFDVVLDDLKRDPKGQRVDVANEIISNLRSPLYFSNRVSNGTVCRLLGIRADNLDVVTRAIDKIYAGDSKAKKIGDAGFAAWQVNSLQRSENSNTKSYIVAIRNGYVLIAPNLQSLNEAFSQTGSIDSWFTPSTSRILGEKSSLGFASDLRHLFQFRHDDLKRGVMSGGIGQLFRSAQMQAKLKTLPRSNWPTFDELAIDLNARFRFLANSNQTGWKFVAEISE